MNLNTKMKFEFRILISSHFLINKMIKILSSPGPKPKNPKPRGLGLTLKSHGPPPPPPHPPTTFKHEGGVPQ